MKILFGSMGVGVALAAVFYVAFWVTAAWVGGSLLVSGAKVALEDCGSTYPIEQFPLEGDWFCKEEPDAGSDNE